MNDDSDCQEAKWPLIDFTLSPLDSDQHKRCASLEECSVYDWVLARDVPEWMHSVGSHLLAAPEGLPWLFKPIRCVAKNGTVHQVWMRFS